MATTSRYLVPSGTQLGGVNDVDAARKIRFGNASEDYAVFNTLTQKYESAKTGNPWHGKVIGGYAVQGKFSSTPSADMPAEPGAQPVQFTTTKTVKQPEIASATGNTLNQQQQVATQTASAFQDFLKQARELNAQSRDQLTQDQAAFDTSKIEASLPANDAAYRAAQERVTGDMATRNKTFADQTQATLDRLTAENRAYETNAQAVADRAYGAAMKRNNLYQLGSGTPTSGSGANTNRYIKAYQDINVPLQRELADRRYSQIANIERPYQNQIYGNDLALLNRESGLASDFANRTDNTMKFLQNLRMQVAGMSRAQAQDYLTKLGLPIELGQRIIAGDIANLSGIQRLDELANYYTIQTPFDVSRIPQVQSFPVSGGFRSYSPSIPDLPATSNPVASGNVPGINYDGSPRVNPLAPDYSSWLNASTVPRTSLPSPSLVVPPQSTYLPDFEYSGYPAGSSFLPTTGSYSYR